MVAMESAESDTPNASLSDDKMECITQIPQQLKFIGENDDLCHPLPLFEPHQVAVQYNNFGSPNMRKFIN